MAEHCDQCLSSIFCMFSNEMQIFFDKFFISLICFVLF